jgi:anti-sigma factor RsiW
VSRHLELEEVHRFVDGELSADQGRRVEEHLQSCGDCRAWADQLDALRQQLAELRDAGAAGDLWPGIAWRVATSARDEQLSRARHRSSANRRAIWSGIAALVVVVAGAALMLGGNRQPALVARPGSAAADTLVATFVPIIENLQRIAHRQAVLVAPGVAERLHEDLTANAHAVSEIRVALARDPGDVELSDELTRAFRREVAFLEWVVRVTPGDAR